MEFDPQLARSIHRSCFAANKPARSPRGRVAADRASRGHPCDRSVPAFVASTRRSPRRQIFLEFEELPDFAIGKLAGFFDILLRIDFPYRNIIFRLRGTGDRLLADIRGLLRTVAPKVLWCLCILAELRLSWRNTGRPRLGLVDYIQLGSVSVCEFCHGRCVHSHTAPDVPVSQG